jgi:hypothetical protein
MTDRLSSFLSFKCAVAQNPDNGGWFVLAQAPIAKGELIAVWSGRLVSAEDLANLPLALKRRTVQVEEDLYMTSLHLDEPADCINHSCEPNAGLSGQIAVVAMRTISPGEEITIDYAMCDGSAYDEFTCLCGSPGCRGKISGEDWRMPELWARYRGYFSPYLQRRIQHLSAGIRRIRKLSERRGRAG